MGYHTQTYAPVVLSVLRLSFCLGFRTLKFKLGFNVYIMENGKMPLVSRRGTNFHELTVLCQNDVCIILGTFPNSCVKTRALHTHRMKTQNLDKENSNQCMD